MRTADKIKKVVHVTSLVVGDCTGSDAVGAFDGTRTAAADSSRVADSENAMGDAVGDVAGVVEDTVRRSTRLATKTNNTPVNTPTVARLEICFIVLGCDVCSYNVYNCEEEHSTTLLSGMGCFRD